MALSWRGTRQSCTWDTLCLDHRPTSARAAERRARCPQYGGRYAEAAPAGIADDSTLERRVVGARPSRLALSHEHAGDAHAPRATHKSMAGHACAPSDEPRS